MTLFSERSKCLVVVILLFDFKCLKICKLSCAHDDTGGLKSDIQLKILVVLPAHIFSFINPLSVDLQPDEI